MKVYGQKTQHTTRISLSSSTNWHIFYSKLRLILGDFPSWAYATIWHSIQLKFRMNYTKSFDSLWIYHERYQFLMALQEFPEESTDKFSKKIKIFSNDWNISKLTQIFMLIPNMILVLRWIAFFLKKTNLQMIRNRLKTWKKKQLFGYRTTHTNLVSECFYLGKFYTKRCVSLRSMFGKKSTLVHVQWTSTKFPPMCFLL